MLFFPPYSRKVRRTTKPCACAARAKDGRGFVFLSNCQRYGDMHDLKDVQVELVLKGRPA